MTVLPPDAFALASLAKSEEVPAANGDLTKAAQAFEAIFLRQMLAAARATDFGGDDLFGGPGLEQFEKMHDEHIATLASESGAFGFARLIEAQLAAHLPAKGDAGDGE